MSASLRIKKKLKVVVRWAQSHLPERVYNRAYGVAFPAYKGFLRAAYLANGFVRYAGRDAERWQMVRDIHRIMPRTLVGAGGLEATYALAKEMVARGVPGDFVELGVARGGCAALLGTVLFERSSQSDRVLRLFDSFEGLPEPGAEDLGADNTTGDHVHVLTKGSCLGTLEDVTDFVVGARGFPASRIDFVKGWFQDTVPVAKDLIGSVALLRIDGDWYDSTKVCLEGLYDRVPPGGAVIIDDYQSCYGCTKAVDEFLDQRQLSVDMRFDGRGGCWFIKPATS